MAKLPKCLAELLPQDVEPRFEDTPEQIDTPTLIEKCRDMGATVTVDAATNVTNVTWGRDNHTPEEWSAIMEWLLGKDLKDQLDGHSA